MRPRIFSLIIKLIYFTFLLACHGISYGDVVAGTTVLTPHGLVSIEKINVGDYVIGYENNALVENQVIYIAAAEADVICNIVTDQGIIQATTNQLFYDSCTKRWIKVKELTTGSIFLKSDLHHCSCQSITPVTQKATTYRISTTSPLPCRLLSKCIYFF